MKMRKMAWLLLWVGWAGWAQAEYREPSAEQLREAAQQPDTVSDLLVDATADQAAQVVALVLDQMMSLDLEDTVREARVTGLIQALFKAYPGQVQALAQSLGTHLALAGSANATPGLLSLIQQTVIAASGDAGPSAGAAFGQGYLTTLSGGNTKVGNGLDGLWSVAPPVGQGYEVQQLP